MATEMDDLPQSEGLMAFLLRENDDEPEILGAPYFQRCPHCHIWWDKFWGKTVIESR